MKTKIMAILAITLMVLAFAMPMLAEAKENGPYRLVIMELRENQNASNKPTPPPPPTDLGMSTTTFAPTGFMYTGYAENGLATANYWINPNNKYRFSVSAVEQAITTSAETWDIKTTKTVFNYKGTATNTYGVQDGVNVIDFGLYQNGVIAVTVFWYNPENNHMVEIDMRMNTMYKWSLNGAARTMDVQNIVTHEFGHWVGLADIYPDSVNFLPNDIWLTMYGYSSYGVTYQRTLGQGDINGIQAVYGL
jgi:hypothetical protein